MDSILSENIFFNKANKYYQIYILIIIISDLVNVITWLKLLNNKVNFYWKCKETIHNI